MENKAKLVFLLLQLPYPLKTIHINIYQYDLDIISSYENKIALKSILS